MDKRKLEEGLEQLIQFSKRGGLVPAVAQDYNTGEVLMLAYVNVAALKETLSTGYATFWSTSRDELWTKGEKSGEYLRIKEILTDCDQDALIYRVERLGKGACHTNNQIGYPRRSCFYRRVTEQGLEFLHGIE